MKVVRLFRTLGFQPEGKDMVRGPDARGTLAIIEPDDGVEKYSAKFIRDVDGDVLELDVRGFDVIPGVPTNKSVVLVLPDEKRHTFIAYRELPAADASQFTVIQAGINPTVRYET